MSSLQRVSYRLFIWSSRGWIFGAALGVALAGCGEPMFENAGSQQSLLEVREACAMEIDQSPEALAYRQNPAAHPEYPTQVFEEMNRCIERRGWKQVRSPQEQEQEQVRQAITSEATRTPPPVALSDPKATDALVRAIESKLAASRSGTQP